ncbi:response regulator [Asticcacaulis sp. 201]|uniref:response regulator n=1 Tax=Asticcacaulis sp. 201 TaxID=3028787 RepID=UPI002916D02D|nr:response regulator [Asticcacaulis sp. 201]MDV6332228.1 response regulator [Asticcacaulis sp. 201]
MTTQHSQTQRLLRRINSATTSVLIVEDNDASRRLVMELLRAAGFNNLSFARNAEEAIDHLQAQNPDLMLLDWGLPGMSGIELVTALRQAALLPDPRFPNPQLPVVMLTARQRAHDVTLARNAGVNEFVIKPFSTSSLLRALSSALVKKRRFVVSENFVGPDRRRRAGLFPGLLRRAEDAQELSALGQRSLGQEINALRGLIRAEGQSGTQIDRDHVNQVVMRLMHTQTVAHDFRMKLIEQATQSLNDYVRLFGEKAEADVLDVHLDALTRLNEIPYADPDEALDIIKHLTALVDKRKANRKVA